jgi:GDP-L-fucose synthase
MKFNEKIFLAGHKGLVGSAILRRFNTEGYKNLILRESSQLDLTNQISVDIFFKKEKPEIVILAAAKVGGIYANSTYPADFIYNNIMIQSNVIHAAFKNGVKKFIYLGSSCIYPKKSKQPIKEDYLLSGKLEKTNLAYAIAKISGLIMCQSYNEQYKNKTDFRCLMPTNLYGPNDNYHNLESHVIPALIRKIHEAKIKKINKVTIWGTGKAKRDFLYSDDLADAIIFLLKIKKEKFKQRLNNQYNIINIGSGYEYTVKNLAKIIAEVVGYKGTIICDIKKPDGTLRKFLSNKILNNLGWKPQFKLYEGLKKTYEDYLCSNVK